MAAPTPAQLSLLKTIPINGTAASPNTKLFSFDISFVDPATGLYYLADRSNAALDVVDTTGAFTGTPDSLFGQIGGAAFNFGGDTGLNMPSNVAQGPNGVAARSPCIFATDGLSRVVSINSNVSFVTPMSSVSTGGTHRADELAIDPNDSLLLVINNADTPPFGTLISFSATCALTVKTKIPFTAANGINATNGAEQPAWDPLTQRFYVSIPEINGPGGGDPNGAVAKINPLTGAIEAFYPVNFMQPAGLTLAPNGICSSAATRSSIRRAPRARRWSPPRWGLTRRLPRRRRRVPELPFPRRRSVTRTGAAPLRMVLYRCRASVAATKSGTTRVTGTTT